MSKISVHPLSVLLALIVFVVVSSAQTVNLQTGVITLSYSATTSGTPVINFLLTISATYEWAALGFSRDGSPAMGPKDTILVSTVNGQNAISDAYISAGHNPPIADSQQDAVLNGVTTSGSMRVYNFSRAAITSDSADVNLDGLVTVIWAYGLGSATSPSQHLARASQVTKITFTPSLTPTAPTPAPVPVAPAPPTFPGSIKFSSDLSMSWAIVSTNTTAGDTMIEFTLTLASGVGWGAVGFAIDHDNTMDNKDYWFVSYSNGQALVSDRYNTHGKETPPVDASQDATDISGSSSGGQTSVTFRRKATTGDSMDVSLASAVGVTWAVGPGDASSPQQHNSYSSSSRVVNFLTGDVGSASDNDPNWVYFVFFCGVFCLFFIGVVLRKVYPASRTLLHNRLFNASPWFDLTHAEWAFFLCFIILLIVWLVAWFVAKKTATGKVPRPFGFGLLPVMALALFPVGRRSPVLWLLGTDYLRALRFHKLLGNLALLFMLIHGIGMLIAYKGGRAVEWDTPSADGVNPLAGLISGISLVFVMAPPAIALRRTHWNLFQWSHILGFILVIVFGILHYVTFVWYLILPLGLYLVDWLLRVYGIASTGTATAVNVERASDVVGLRLQLPKGQLKFEPGSHVYVNVPRIAKTEWHPFSLSCCQEDTQRDGCVTLHIKDMGPGTYTNALVGQAQRGEQMLLEGPYGRLSLDPLRHRGLLLVGGGVGITPLASILAHCCAHAGPQTPQRVFLLWSVQSEGIASLFAPLISHASKTTGMQFHPIIHVTRGNIATDIGVPMIPGRPDLSSVIRYVAGQLALPLPGQTVAPPEIAMYLCGPDTLTTAAAQAAADFNATSGGSGAVRFVVHKETFAL